MRDRSLLGALLLIGLVVPLTSCNSSPSLTSISVSPTSINFGGAGLTTQLLAIGSYTHPGHPAITKDITDQVTWSSASTDCVTVSSGGLITSQNDSCSNIPVTASAPGFNGDITGSMTVNVTIPSGGTGGGTGAEPLLSIAVMPSSITVLDLLGTGQFLAYGTFSTPPTVMDITNGINHDGYVAPVTWISSAQTIFPINSAGAPGSTGGLITAVGSGNAEVYATAANPDGSLVISPTVTFNCPYAAYVPASGTTPATLGTCNEETVAPGLLVTLTVFNAGLDTTNWLVTAPSATGTLDVIHCGGSNELNAPGGSVCTATYPLGATILLTATQTAGSVGTFGGWSWNCTPSDASGAPLPGPVFYTAVGPNYCTVTLGSEINNTSNESVGAIFN
jgi:hypothetical protein